MSMQMQPLMEEGMKKNLVAEKISELLSERNDLLEYYKTVMDESSLLTEEDASSGGEDSLYCCLLEERGISKTELVEEIYFKLKEKEKEKDNSTLSLKYVDHKLQLLGKRILYGIDHPESAVQEDTNPESLWCWEANNISHLPELHRASIIVRRSFRANIHARIMALSKMIHSLTTFADPDILGLEYELSKTANKEKVGKMYDSSKKRMAEKAAKLELRKKKLQEESERRILEKENLLSENERKRLQKEMERKLARFDEKKKKHCEKTIKRRLKIEEELAKLNREATEEEGRIEKEKQDMRIKLEAENEVKFSKWLKERSTPPADLVRSTPSTPPQSPEYIDVDRRIMDEATSPIASPPCVSIERENLLTDAPRLQGPQEDQNEV